MPPRSRILSRNSLVILGGLFWLGTQLGLQAAATDMVLVGTHPTSPLTAYPRLHSLKAFQGRLYTGYGDWNDYPACMIACYLPTGNEWRCEYAPGSDSLGIFREIDGALYASHCDPIHYEDFRDFSYYQPGAGWRDRTPLGLYHAFDFCNLGTKLYFCGAKDSHEGAPNTTNNNALLMQSSDAGKSWSAANPTSNGYSRFYWCFPMNGLVYTQGGTYNGSTWTNSSTLSAYPNLYKPTLLAPTSGSLMMGLEGRTPGLAATASSRLITFDGTTIRTLTDAVYDFTWDGAFIYALRTTGIFRGTATSATSITWVQLPITAVPADATCLEVMSGRAYVGDGLGRLWTKALDANSPASIPLPTIVNAMPDGIGRSIVFDGSTAIVSAHEAGQTRASDGVLIPVAGKVSAWQRNVVNSTWTASSELNPPTPWISGWYGKDISIKNGFLGVVEAGYDLSNLDRGSSARVHLYQKGTAGWTPRSLLTIPFAHSVVVDENLLVIGSANPAVNQAAGKPSLYPYSINRPPNAGAITVAAKLGIAPVVNNWGYKPVSRCAMTFSYIMGGFSGDISRNGGVGMISLWSRSAVETATVVAPAPIQEISTVLPDRYGFAIALSDRYAVVGAPRDDTAAKQAGAVYVYEITSASQPLVQRMKIICPLAQTEAAFGSAVALRGDTLLVGAPGLDVGAVIGRGEVYIYRFIAGSWIAQGTLPVPLKCTGGYGVETSLSADWIAAGSRYTDASSNLNERVALAPMPPPADYTAWTVTNSLAGGDTDGGADPDRDSLVNVIEYASGLDPRSPQRPSLSATTASLSGLPIVFVRAGVGPMIRYLTHPKDLRLRQVVELSSNLTTWTPVTLTSVLTVLSDVTMTLVEAPLPAGPAGKPQFARLRVELTVP